MLIYGVLVYNNTHGKLCISLFAIYFTPDSQIQINMYDLWLRRPIKIITVCESHLSSHTILDLGRVQMFSYRTRFKKPCVLFSFIAHRYVAMVFSSVRDKPKWPYVKACSIVCSSGSPSWYLVAASSSYIQILSYYFGWIL
jgi:hypothetical protein